MRLRALGSPVSWLQAPAPPPAAESKTRWAPERRLSSPFPLTTWSLPSKAAPDVPHKATGMSGKGDQVMVAISRTSAEFAAPPE